MLSIYLAVLDVPGEKEEFEAVYHKYKDCECGFPKCSVYDAPNDYSERASNYLSSRRRNIGTVARWV